MLSLELLRKDLSKNCTSRLPPSIIPFLKYTDYSSITVFFLYVVDEDWQMEAHGQIWPPKGSHTTNPKSFLPYLMDLSHSLHCTSKDKQMREKWLKCTKGEGGGTAEAFLMVLCGRVMLVSWIQKMELILLTLPSSSTLKMAQLIKCQADHEARGPGTISLLYSVQPLPHDWQWTNIY